MVVNRFPGVGREEVLIYTWQHNNGTLPRASMLITRSMVFVEDNESLHNRSCDYSKDLVILGQPNRDYNQLSNGSIMHVL